MKIDSFADGPKHTYMLLPAMPTPNGRLHLGHIGGPFLSVDILARHLRMYGHKAIVVSGTDTFDSYVTGQSDKEHKTNAEVCNHYHELISSDLGSMQMSISKFVNPLSREWSDTYQGWLHQLLADLKDAGITRSVTETVGIDESSNRFLTGCRLPGNCPVCHASIRGYFCEDCGAHFRPEEVVNAPATSIKKQVTNLFMELPEDSDLDNRGLDPTILAVYQMFVDQQSPLRLTASSEWGLPVDVDGAGEIGDGKFFNYSFAYAYALMLGEIAAQIAAASSSNALSSDSDMITVGAFGIDNTIPVLGSISGITAGCRQYKQFDYYLVNHFLDLDGSKFSTSRRHAIWVDDIINQVGASSDIVRLFLSKIELRNSSGNVDSNELVEFYNQTVSWIERLVVNGMASLPDMGEFAVDPLLLDKLQSCLTEQAAYLNPAEFRSSGASKSIDSWLEIGESLDPTSPNYFWWLKGLVVLINPFMPGLAGTLWTTLGYLGEPVIHEFESAPMLPVQKHVPTNLKRLSKADILVFAGVTAS